MRHEDYHVIEAAFVDGFRTAPDKRAFLQLARVPFELGPLKLLDVRLDETFTVGAASRGFGSAELVYHPLPGEMVARRLALVFVYVSATETREMSLADVLAEQGEPVADGDGDHGHGHGHHHHHHHHHHHA